MKRIVAFLLCMMLCLLMTAWAEEEKKPAIVADVQPHAAAFSCELPEYDHVYVKYASKFDSGEMVLRGDNGVFSGVCPLPATYDEQYLTITVHTLGGRTLLRWEGKTVPAEMGTPFEGLEPVARPAGSARDLTLTPEENGVRYSFNVPGRAQVYVKAKSPQESHQIIVFAGENYVYEGFVEMPLTYADDNITFSVITVESNYELSSETVRAYYEPLPAVEQAAQGRLKGVTVCIDPGHQRKTEVETVPLGPNFSKKSTTTVGMAQGVVTARREAIVVLEVGLILRNMLLQEGANVVMTREVQDTFVGMLERADIPNEAGADFVLRLHCNSRNDANVQGIQVFCPYQSSYALEVADEDTYREMGFTLLHAMQKTTGQDKGTCKLNNTYVSNNWSKMPSFLVEMGYMSNREEDLLMANSEYQQLLAQGMVEGIVELSRMRGLID